MAIFKQFNYHSLITSSLLSSIALAMIIFSGILISASTKLSNTTGTHQGKFGPLTLFELFKTPLAIGGYNAGINFKSEILYYFSFWIAIGILIVFVRLGKEKRHGKV